VRRSHFGAWAPRCPVCARDRGRAAALLLAPGAVESGGDVLAGTLICAEPACRHEYPVIDGIPVITAALRQTLGERAVELLLRDDLPAEALGQIGDALGPDSWLDTLRQGVSTYGWDAYADADPEEPPPASPGAPRPGAARRVLAALLDLAAPLPEAPARVLDLGCAAGRTSFDLAAAAPGALVLGIDGNLALLRLARRVAARGEVRYGRRRIGLVYDERRFPLDPPGRERVDFWACDAAALPFAPGSADLVAALNLLDCVPDPLALLRGMATALAPGGALLLATPFDWAARATPLAAWIGGHSGRGAMAGAAEPLLEMLLDPSRAGADGTRGGASPDPERPGPGWGVAGLEIGARGEHDWHTRLHDRSAVLYRTHLVTARHRSRPSLLDKGS